MPKPLTATLLDLPGHLVVQGYATAFANGGERLTVLVAAGSSHTVQAVTRTLRQHREAIRRAQRTGTFVHLGELGVTRSLYILPAATVYREPLRPGITGLVVVADPQPGTTHLWARPGQTLGAALRAHLQTTYHLPLLPTWEADLLTLLRPWITPWTVTGHLPPGATLDEQGPLVDTVLDAIRQGILAIPTGAAAADVPVATLADLHAYLRQFGRALAAPLLQQALHQPGTAPPPAVPRALYPAQADAVAAIQKVWARGQRTAWLIGEAGVGKTAIGLTSAYLSLQGRPGRILVMAPGHLIDKWVREAAATLPAAVTPQVVRQAAEALPARRALQTPPTGPELWILGRDAAKLGPMWHFAGVPRRTGTYRCPDCGTELATPAHDPRTPPAVWTAAQVAKRTAANAQCPACGTPLWRPGCATPTPFGSTAATGTDRRWAPDRLWRRLPRGTFDVMILDEAHEEKGDTAQGIAAGRLLTRARRALLMTGTLLGGKASDLGWLLARTEPLAWKARGWSPTRVAAFVAAYGRREHVATEGRTLQREVPGVHPAVFADWLIDKAVFLELADLSAQLPPFHEEVHLPPMRADQAARVTAATATLRTRIAAALAQGDRTVLGHLLHATAVLPDLAWSDQPITTRAGVCLVPAQPPLPGVTPKEAAVVLTVLRAKARGRRSLVFVLNTGVYDLTARYRALFEAEGLTVAHLPASVPPGAREAWIAAHPADVLITHPKLVGTGLDLLEYSTICWVQTGWSLFTLRQASRRSWRLGQTQPVDVHYFAYADTVQETILQALGEKQLAADAIEGRFTAEGLELLGTGQSVLIRVAQAVAVGLAALPDLRQVWTVAADDPAAAMNDTLAPPAHDASGKAAPRPVLALFPARSRRGRAPGQLSLFDEAM